LAGERFLDGGKKRIPSYAARTAQSLSRIFNFVRRVFVLREHVLRVLAQHRRVASELTLGLRKPQQKPKGGTLVCLSTGMLRRAEQRGHRVQKPLYIRSGNGAHGRNPKDSLRQLALAGVDDEALPFEAVVQRGVV